MIKVGEVYGVTTKVVRHRGIPWWQKVNRFGLWTLRLMSEKPRGEGFSYSGSQ